MDYRELENRMEQNRSMIRDRAYQRLVKEAKKANQANKPQRRSWFAVLRSILLSLRQRLVKPQPHVQLKPRANSSSQEKIYQGKG